MWPKSRLAGIDPVMRVIPVLLVICATAAQNSQAATAVTFNHEVGPIIYRNCSPCHRPGEAASYSYRDERRLTPQEIELIQAWVKADMPEGNAAEKPEAPKFASGWRLGEPDLVV